jgi:putative transcriptional regulator
MYPGLSAGFASAQDLATSGSDPTIIVAIAPEAARQAVRFSTLDAMCRVLECQPGDLLEWVAE